MKLLKLNARGVAHHFLLALIVVGVAVGGTYYLIASHADTCDTSEPTSGIESSPTSDPDSSPVCNPDSGPVTAPASSPETLSATCTINNLPDSIMAGSTIKPSISVTNTGTTPLAPSMISFVSGNNSTSYFKEANLPIIQPGASVSASLGSYKTAANYYGIAGVYAHSDLNKSAADADFNCQKNFTVTNPTYTLSCSISGIPTNVKHGQSFTPTITIKNTGTGTLYPDFSTYYYIGTNSGVLSRNQQTVKLSALRGGTSVSKKLAKFTISETYNSKFNLKIWGGGYKNSNYSSSLAGFNCTKGYTLSVPAVKSVTIYPSDWKLNKYNTLAKDGSHGSVVKMTLPNYAALKGITSTVSKLNTFVGANLGKNIELCATAKTPPHNGSDNGLTFYPGFDKSIHSISWNFGSSYSKKCATFPAKKTTDFGWHGFTSSGLNALLDGPHGADLGSIGYLDNVTLTAK